MLRILVTLAIGGILGNPLGVLPQRREPPAPAPPVSAARARAWLEAQRADLLAALEAGNPQFVRLRRRSWEEAAERLASTGAEKDAKGFIIYPPSTALGLFLYDRAAAMYEAADRGGAAAIPSVDALFRLGGERLSATVPEKYPSAARARAVLAGLAVPASAARGFRVYLLPFSLGDLSGLGGPGFAIIAAEPADERLIPNQLEVTLAHEFGHHLHLAGMPRDTAAGRARWVAYLRLRRLPWREDGRVKTKAWAHSPEETFAEDFRLLFGGAPADEEPAATLAGDPRRNRSLSSGLRTLMKDVARAMPPVRPEPWPKEAGVAPLVAADVRFPWKIPVAAGVMIALTWAGYRRRGAVSRPPSRVKSASC